MAYAQEMAWFSGFKAAFLWQLGVKEFKTILEGKRLLAQKMKQKSH
jgi:hypothetical protein